MATTVTDTWNNITALLQKRDRDALATLVVKYPWIPYSVATKCSIKHVKWFFDSGLGHVDGLSPHSPSSSILHDVVHNTSLRRYGDQKPYFLSQRPVLRYLLHARANTEVWTKDPDNDSPSQRIMTPLGYAIDNDAHYAVSQLLKAGASIGVLSSKDQSLIWEGWFPCWTACRATVLALFGANKRFRYTLPKDVIKLIAARVWRKRYHMVWLQGGEGGDRTE